MVGEPEWNDVIDFIFNNKEFFTAVSFIPDTGDKIYPQAPNEAVISEDDKKKFEELKNNWKRVEYTKLVEEDDETVLQKEIACAGSACEIVRV
jgi:hypothetical protein